VRGVRAFRAPIVALLITAFGGAAASAQGVEEDGGLSKAIMALDEKVFAAYNRCDLASFGSYFSPTVEFYHDTGGATFDRATVIANTRKYICGKVHREPILGTLKVYPINGFGAIEEGEHRFCQIATGRCEGVAKFLIIWKGSGDTWQITRVLSYGHRAMTDDLKAPH